MRAAASFVPAVAIALAAAACDRPPAADNLKEWTPEDHGGEQKTAGPNAKQGTRGDAGGTPALVEITWRTACSGCHGMVGKGDGPQAAMFKPPDLTKSKSDDETLLETIKNGKGRMPKQDIPDDVARGLVLRVKSFRGP